MRRNIYFQESNIQVICVEGFFQSRRKIKILIYSVKSELRHAMICLENLQHLIKAWKTDTSVYFRQSKCFLLGLVQMQGCVLILCPNHITCYSRVRSLNKEEEEKSSENFISVYLVIKTNVNYLVRNISL